LSTKEPYEVDNGVLADVPDDQHQQDQLGDEVMIHRCSSVNRGPENKILTEKARTEIK
jgi:hypothetical protein